MAGFFDAALLKYRKIRSGNQEFPARASMRIVGGTVQDSPATDETLITLPGGGGSAPTADLALTSAALSPGDWISALTTDPTKVTRTTPTVAAASQNVKGVVVDSYSPGDVVTFAPVGSVVASSVFGDLGAGVASNLTMSSAGRAHRATASIDNLVTGGEVYLGRVDANGNVTVDPFVPTGSTPSHEFNVKAHGIVADGNRVTGTGTDNYAALQAMLDAIPRDSSNLTPLVIKLPPGVIRVSQTLNVPVCVRLEGAVGAMTGTSGSFATWLMGDPGVTPLKITDVAAIGSTVRHIGFCNPITKPSGATGGGVPFNRLNVGVPVVLDQVVVPSSETRGFKNVIFKCTTSGTPSTTVLTHPQSGGTVTINDEPLWPIAWSPASSGSPIPIYGYTEGVFPIGTKILEETLANATVPYEYRSSGGTVSGSVRPDSGDYPTWQANHAYAPTLTTFTIPTSAFAGSWSYFELTTAGTSGGSEPAWDTTPGHTTNDGTAVWTCVGAVWPRIVGKHTTDNTITWTLTSTSPTYTTGSAVFSAKFQNPGLVVSFVAHIDDCSVDHMEGNCFHMAATGGAGTALNGSTIRRCNVASSAGHGVYFQGADSNGCHIQDVGGLALGGSLGKDASFLGNLWEGCQAAICAAGSYQITDPSSKGMLVGCYQEGGQPPSRVLGAATVLGNNGVEAFTFDSSSNRFGAVNQPYSVGVSKQIVPWGLHPVTKQLFRYNGSSDGDYFYHDPTTFKFYLNDLVRASTDNKYIYSAFSIATYTVIGATNASPIVIQTSASITAGIKTGDNVTISGVLGNTAANGTWRVTVVDSTHFSLDNSTGNGTWSSGGTQLVTPAAGYPGFTEPTWPTVFGNTVVDGTITWKCIGISGLGINLGTIPNWIAPGVDNVLSWFSSVETASFPTQIMRAYQFAPDYWALTHSSNDGNACMLIPGVNARGLHGEVQTGTTVLPYALEIGRFNVAGRYWGFQRNSTFPTTTSYEKGRAAWFGDQSTQQYMGGTLVTSSGGGDTWNYFGKIVAPTLEVFDTPSLRWAGDLTGGSSTLPATDSVRGEVQTTNNTTTTAHTIAASTSGTVYRVCVEVVAKRTDVVGDFSTFLLKGAWLNSSGTLVADAGGPKVIEGAPTDVDHYTAGASAWTAILDTSSTSVRVRVTGENSKTIHWSIVREQVEAL